MSLISGLTNQTIDSISSVSRNAYNKETKTEVYSSVPCRWQHAVDRNQSSISEKLDYDIVAWLEPDYSIESSYIITKDEKDYKIVKINEHYDLSGELDHISLFLV
jgi:hypothetical protein